MLNGSLVTTVWRILGVQMEKTVSNGKLNQAGGETLLSAFHKLIYSIRNKEEFPDQCKEIVIIPIQCLSIPFAMK
jgi:hypothetical protein